MSYFPPGGGGISRGVFALNAPIGEGIPIIDNITNGDLFKSPMVGAGESTGAAILESDAQRPAPFAFSAKQQIIQILTNILTVGRTNMVTFRVNGADKGTPFSFNSTTIPGIYTNNIAFDVAKDDLMCWKVTGNAVDGGVLQYGALYLVYA